VDKDTIASFERGINAVPSEASLATARWATPDEIGAHEYDTETGLFLGEISTDDNGLGLGDEVQFIGFDDDSHIISTAKTRSGKGVSLIIPNLLCYEGSIFVLDPKGENATLTAIRRGGGDETTQGLNQDVFVLDPFRVADVPEEYRASFNPLDWMPEDDLLIYEASALATSIVKTSQHADPYWNESARDLIATLIMHVMTCDSYRPASSPETEDNKLPRNLLTIRKLLMDGSEYYVERQKELIALETQICREVLADLVDGDVASDDDIEIAEKALEAAESKLPPYPFDALFMEMAENEALGGAIASRARAFTEIPQKERGSILSSTRHQTEFLDGDSIGNCLSHSTFDIRALREKPTSVYLCLPTRFLKSHSRWLRTILGFALNQFESMGLANHDDPKTLFVLDEMATLGHLGRIEEAAGLMAGYGLKLWMILQNLGQLKRHYKDGWETLIANAGTITAFGVADNTTAEYLSKALGKVEIERQIVTESASLAVGENRNKGAPAGANFGGSRIKAELNRLQETEVGSGETHNETHGTTTNTQLTIGNLMNPDEIVNFFSRKNEKMLVLMDGERPMVLDRTKYYGSPTFSQFMPSKKG
jgi:type IV secretory pathway TraG/TraD family ATPase VirD4